MDTPILKRSCVPDLRVKECHKLLLGYFGTEIGQTLDFAQSKVT